MKNEEKKAQDIIEEVKNAELSDYALDELAGGAARHTVSQVSGLGQGKTPIGEARLGGNNAGVSQAGAGTSGVGAATAGIGAATAGIGAATAGAPNVAGTDGKPSTASANTIDTPGLW